MPSERILNKLFEIAQENTSEEVNYNDFVKDLLNSANLTIEDKTYNAEDEYLRNLLVLAKHDSKIFGEYKNGKFVISESIIKSAQKETQRNINVRKIKNDELKPKEENNSVFTTIGEKIKNFADLSLEDKLSLIRNTDDMSDEEFKDYTIKIIGDAKEAKKDGIITEEEEKDLEDSMHIKSELRGKSIEERRRYIEQEINCNNPYFITNFSKFIKSPDMIQWCDNIPYNHHYSNSGFMIESFINGGKDGVTNSDLIKLYDLYADYLEKTIDDKVEDIVSRVHLLRESMKTDPSKADVEKWRELVSKQIEEAKRKNKAEEKGIKIGDKSYLVGLNLYGDKKYKLGDEIEEEQEKFIKQVYDKEIEEKKASEEPGLEALAVFDGGFEDFGLPANGDFMSAFGEFGDASLVTDREFDEAFDIIEIGNTRTGEPRNADIVLEEEPEMDGENETRPSVIVEKINSDAVTLEPKQEETKPAKLSLDSVLKQSEKAKKRKVAFYFRKVKELAHAEIDINKINQIDDIA